MTHHHPPPAGAWLRPIGQWYGYCLRVLNVFPPSEGEYLETIEFERWGLDRARCMPVRDEHANHSWHHDLRQVLPGVWREVHGDSWPLGPRYYRLMDSAPAGQMEIFA